MVADPGKQSSSGNTGQMNAGILMVIIPDRLTSLIRKGEITERYYNPGELFGEVHIVLNNDDDPDPKDVQKTVGKAKLFIHNLPRPGFVATLGWQMPLLRRWRKAGLELARSIKPQLIRTHNNFLEGYLASEIKKKFGTPYVVSLHGVWDRDCLTTPLHRLRRQFMIKLERAALTAADAVIAVYKPVVRYAKAHGASRVELIYNIVAGIDIKPRQNYARCGPLRLITINRQLKEKNPENIIRAIQDMDCEYLLVGDGPYHERLKALVAELGVGHKVRFVKALPNQELCTMLSTFDVMVAHCDYWGISKTTIEGALAGLPIVLNQHPIEPVPDLEGNWLVLCENTPDGYKEAIGKFADSEALRAEYGRRALAHAREYFEPGAMEARTVALYREVMGL
jgi:glycosyltransferase involved in cell wall biosynthesis